MYLESIILSILFVHQTLDVIGVKGYVSRPELISPDTIGWCILTILMILYFMQIPFVPIIMLIIFILVVFGFYQFHWKLYFFGASQKKIDGYNEYFSGTHRIMAESAIRLIPDTFHIIHTLLYILAVIILFINHLVL